MDQEERAMADEIRRADYFYITVPNKPGEGARVLGALRDAGVNLLAFSGFPEGRAAQMDFVPEDAAAFRRAAKTGKWKLTGPKKVFLISGEERPGAVAEVVQKLADAKVNVIALDAACAGSGLYGGMLWVAPREVARAAKVLGAQ
jgi:prephenate dehydratase